MGLDPNYQETIIKCQLIKEDFGLSGLWQAKTFNQWTIVVKHKLQIMILGLADGEVTNGVDRNTRRNVMGFTPFMGQKAFTRKTALPALSEPL